MRWDKNNIREGMFVTSTKGERIGKVIRRDGETFVVEKGALFPKDYELRYDHITDIKDEGVSYALGDLLQREERSQRTDAGLGGTAATASLASATPIATAESARLAAAKIAAAPRREVDGEVRIPLMKEELEVEKVQRESGHVKIHKEVKTEEKHFTVPVRREEVVIEHVTAFAGGVGTGGDAEFKEETVDIPLHEEEIRVTTRPVLREEIVVRTVAHSVEKEASATLRHEEADIEDTRKTARIASPSTSSDGGFNAPGRR